MKLNTHKPHQTALSSTYFAAFVNTFLAESLGNEYERIMATNSLLSHDHSLGHAETVPDSVWLDVASKNPLWYQHQRCIQVCHQEISLNRTVIESVIAGSFMVPLPQHVLESSCQEATKKKRYGKMIGQNYP